MDGVDGVAAADRRGANVSGEVSVLGNYLVVVSTAAGPQQIELSAIQRKVLAVLADHRQRPVERGALISAIWGVDAPRTVQAALNNQISRIRQLCGPDIITTVGDRYALGWPTDLDRAADDLSRAESALATGDAVGAERHAEALLTRFNGEAPAEHASAAPPGGAASAAASLHRSAEIVRLRAAVARGRLGWAAFEAERLVGIHPRDESCWALLAEVHERSGRRGEALGVIDQARRMLRDTLGLYPGPQLTTVLETILANGVEPVVPTRSSMVGRSEELDAIEGALAGNFVVVRGEAGSGRSSVMAESARRSRSSARRIGFVRCAASPATPLAELDALLDDLGVTVDPRFGLLNGFVRALDNVAERPVVLYVDDVHLAGPSTLAALRSAAESGSARIVASTDLAADWVWRDSDQFVDLGPLDVGAVGEMATAIVGRELSPATHSWLATVCGGNPSLLVELLHDPAVRDAVQVEGVDAADRFVETVGRGSIAGFAGLTELVRRRLGRLGGRTQIAIEIAAVCGDSAPTALLERLAPSPEGLTAAHAIGLLDRSGTVTRFRHAAVQRVVYSDLSPGRRMELHHLVGRSLLDDGAPAAAVARHLLEAVPLDAHEAVASARGAAGEATRQGAHQEAADWLLRAERCAEAHCAGDSRLLIEVMIARGDALRLAGALDHTDTLYRAADLALEHGDPDLLTDAAFAVLQLGSTSESGGIATRAAELARVAMERADGSEQRARVQAAASLVFSMSGHPERCRGLFVEAERGAVSPATRRWVLPFAYLALGHPRDAPDRTRLAAELRRLATDVDDPTSLFEAHHLAFSACLQRADGDGLREAFAGMFTNVERVGDVGRRWALLYCTAALAHVEDRLDESERLSEAAMAVFTPVSPSRAFAAYGGQLMALRLAQGRMAELIPAFESALVDQPAVPAWHAALAIALADTEQERADHHAAQALDEVPEDFLWLASHVMGGRAAALAGNPTTMQRYRERLLPWQGTTCWQGTCTYGPVDIPLAMLADASGDREAAIAHLDVALSLARRLGAPVYEREIIDLIR